MIDPNKFMEQFLGSARPGGQADAGRTQPGGLPLGGVGGFAGGAMAGGILGLLLGSKKVRKMAGGVAGYGGAAAVGALAWKAYENWKQGQQVASAPQATGADLARVDPRFVPDALPQAEGPPFGLILIQAMIAAAKADGHIDPQEQTRIFEQVDKLGLDAESKAFVFDALRQPPDLGALCQQVRGLEQASEVYLVSLLAAGSDHPAERAWLDALALRLQLPRELVAHLEHQLEADAG